jgi:hypothetical protein
MGGKAAIVEQKSEKKKVGRKPVQEKMPRVGRSKIRQIVQKPSDFIGKFELAYQLQCAVESITEWIAGGRIPPPHSRPGEKHPVWLRAHYDHFKAHRAWPREAFVPPKPGRDAGPST